MTLKVYDKGFTLIEVVVVMAIIAILAILIIGAINIAKNTAAETINRENKKTMQVCLEAYRMKYKAWCDANPPNSCYYEIADPESGWTFDNVIDAMAAKGVPCTLAKTPTAPTDWCKNNTSGRGCSGFFKYIEPDRYKIYIYNFDGSKDIEMFESP